MLFRILSILLILSNIFNITLRFEMDTNLLQIVRLFRENVVLKPAEVSFHYGWKEAIAGDTRPVSELWDDIDAE
jgi:hypothetical protein